MLCLKEIHVVWIYPYVFHQQLVIVKFHSSVLARETNLYSPSNLKVWKGFSPEGEKKKASKSKNHQFAASESQQFSQLFVPDQWSHILFWQTLFKSW